MRYYDFLQKNDITDIYSTRYLDEITESDDARWKRIESQQLELIAAFCRHWYDMDYELRPVFDWVDQDWTENTRVIDGGVFYTAIQDVPAGTLITDESYWIAGDDRNPEVVKMAVYLLVYTLSGRYGTSSIPELWDNRKKYTIDELKGIQKGHIQMDLKPNDIPDDVPEGEYSGHAVNYGSFTETEQQYGF